jgi:lipopolysaccharide assembly outer membrane protein LptD (OstA)
LAVVAISCVAPAWGQATPDAKSAAEKIDVTADSLSFGDGGTQIEAKGNVEIKREVMTLKADEVRINRETNEMEAKGKVSLDDPNWKVKSAESMQFNLQKKPVSFKRRHVHRRGPRQFRGKVAEIWRQTYHIDRDSSRPACVNPARRIGESRATKSTLRLRAQES